MADDAYRTPKGTHDVLPPASARWERLVAAFSARARRAGYGLVITPIFEHVEVFRRVGESTDVVKKEMYEFSDRDKRVLALRPEGTAPVVRAYVQHRPVAPWKVWYVAPNFRHEKPQKGRYRQHFQLGVEVLGVDDPAVDVEVIALAHGFLRDAGLARTRLLLNSMGDEESRPGYVAALRAYLEPHVDRLGPDFGRVVRENPLRVLDSKDPEWRDVVERAPQITEHLSAASREHFEAVQRGLTALGIAYELTPRLVRGFDYYTRTTFEFQSDALDAAQNAVGGGGRYDRLAEQMGGPPTPGIGFGIGVDRVLLAADAEDPAAAAPAALDVFVVDVVGTVEATVLLHELRELGLAADRAYGGRSFKAQMKAADRSGARWGVLLAPRELEHGKVGVRDLVSGEQIEVDRLEVAAWLAARRESEEVARP